MAADVENVVRIAEVYHMAQARKAKVPPRTHLKEDEPFIPKVSEVREGYVEYASRRGRKTVQFWIPEKVLQRFDQWYKSVGISDRTQAIVWLMDDAARTHRRPPTREETT